MVPERGVHIVWNHFHGTDEFVATRIPAIPLLTLRVRQKAGVFQANPARQQRVTTQP